MNQTQLLESIFTYVSTISNIPKVFYPNVKQTNIPDEYVIINVIPTKPDDIGLRQVTMNTGLIQIDVMTLDSIGEIRASEIAQLIINAFPRNTVIPTSLIRIDKTPYASMGLSDGNGHYKVPVTIEYNKVTA